MRHFCNAQKNITIKTISLPCSGKVELIYLLKAFETGSDGAVLITCQQGKCRFLEGNLRAKKRAESVNALLEETGLGKGRMKIIQNTEEGGVKRIIEEIKEFCETINFTNGR